MTKSTASFAPALSQSSSHVGCSECIKNQQHSLFPRCPECPISISNGRNNDHTVHNAKNLKIISIDKLYTDEPYVYTIDGIFHEHDLNKSIITWTCGSNHIFKTEGTKICTGCIIEEQKVKQEAINAANKGVRMTKFNNFNNFDSKQFNSFDDRALL